MFGGNDGCVSIRWRVRVLCVCESFALTQRCCVTVLISDGRKLVFLVDLGGESVLDHFSVTQLAATNKQIRI